MAEKKFIENIEDIKKFLDYEDEKEIVSPGGIKYRIRCLEQYMFLDKGMIILMNFKEFQSSTKTGQELEAEARQMLKKTDIDNNIKPVIIAGMVRPRIIDKRKADCGPGEMSIDLIVKNFEEMIFLSTAITTFSSSAFMGAEGAARRAQFRDEGLAGESGHDGNAVGSGAAPDNRPEGKVVGDGSVQS